MVYKCYHCSDIEFCRKATVMEDMKMLEITEIRKLNGEFKGGCCL